MLPSEGNTEMMKVGEAAEFFRTTTAIIYRLLRQRKIPAFRLGDAWRFRRSDIEKWIEEMTPNQQFEFWHKGRRRH
jgi:excisionase family DNA binding protein